MNQSLKGVVVGQQLWFIPNDIRPDGRGEQPRFMVVTKVGRKWLQLEGFSRRASIETGLVFEGNAGEWCHGQCYVDRDAYQADADLTKAWREFRERVERLQSVPELVTQEWLVESRRVIGTK